MELKTMSDNLAERLRLPSFSKRDRLAAADRIEELEAVLQEVAAWVEGLGYYADEGAILVPIFKKVEAVLGKGYT
jgi:hypothetical protein